MMSHENEENYEPHENHEEGEYHFSDDQISYEMESDAETLKTAPPKASIQTTAVAKIKQYRRLLIGLGVFFALVFIVYKMMPVPASTPVSDFSPNTPAKPAAQAPAAPTSPAPVPVQPVAQAPAPTVPQAVAPSSPPLTASGNIAPAPTPEGNVVAALEQQNSKMMNLMESEYAQRLASSEAQNKEMQTKIDTLNNRIASLEAGLTQITQLLQNTVAKPAPAAIPKSSPAGYPAARPLEPKIAYTVQAIIPGRAWLRSDSGDTITVAEGDMLKNYGKITKIDPYDGIVEIDTGSRLVSLSYGSSSE